MPQATYSLPIHDETARNTFKHRHDTGPPECMLARFQNHNNVSTARCKTRGGRAWPGFEPTRRATLAARTASGRAAAQQHAQRPERASAALEAPPVWRVPEGPKGQAAVLVGGGRAWPGFETTRRATLAARTASGRATAHRHTQRPSPKAGPDGARNNSGATSNTAQGRGPAGPRP